MSAKKRLLAACLIGGLPVVAQADLFVGLHAGASAWNAGLDGDLGQSASSVDNLGFDDDTFNSYYVQVELFALPELRLATTSIDTSGSATLTSDFTLDGNTFSSGQDLLTDLSLDATDVTLYWQILDNALSADIGLSGRYLDGTIAAVEDGNAANSETLDFSAVIPMAFLRARVDLPFSGWYAEADTQFISYGGDRYSDSSAKIGWELESLVDLGVNVGYRSMQVKVDDLDGFDADLDLSGPFATATFHF